MMDAKMTPEDFTFEAVTTRLHQYKNLSERMSEIVPEVNNLLWCMWGILSVTRLDEPRQRFNSLANRWRDLLLEHSEWSVLFGEDLKQLGNDIAKHMLETKELLEEAQELINDRPAPQP